MATAEFTRLEPEATRDRILKYVVPRLGQSMGVVYQDVVFKLLSPEFDENPRYVDEHIRVQSWFDDNVLNILHGLSVLPI